MTTVWVWRLEALSQKVKGPMDRNSGVVSAGQGVGRMEEGVGRMNCLLYTSDAADDC